MTGRNLRVISLIIVFPNNKFLAEIKPRGQNNMMFLSHRLYVNKNIERKHLGIEVVRALNESYEGIYKGDDQKIYLTMLREFNPHNAKIELYYLKFVESVYFNIGFYRSKHMRYLDFSSAVFDTNKIKEAVLKEPKLFIDSNSLSDFEFAANKIKQGVTVC